MRGPDLFFDEISVAIVERYAVGPAETEHVLDVFLAHEVRARLNYRSGGESVGLVRTRIQTVSVGPEPVGDVNRIGAGVVELDKVITRVGFDLVDDDLRAILVVAVHGSIGTTIVASAARRSSAARSGRCR